MLNSNFYSNASFVNLAEEINGFENGNLDNGLSNADSLESWVWGDSCSFVEAEQPCRVRRATGLQCCTTRANKSKCIFKRAAFRTAFVPASMCRVMRAYAADGTGLGSYFGGAYAKPYSSTSAAEIPQQFICSCSVSFISVSTKDENQATPDGVEPAYFIPCNPASSSIFFIESPLECLTHSSNQQQSPAPSSDDLGFDFSEFFEFQQSPHHHQHASSPSNPCYQKAQNCDQIPLIPVFYDADSPCGSVAAQKYELDSSAQSPASSGYHSVSPASTSSDKSFFDMIDDIVLEVRKEIQAETLIVGAASGAKFEARQDRKRKFSYESLSHSSMSSENSPVSHDLSDDVQQIPAPKSGKKFSLAGLSHEEIAERKKEQNRIAAQRYRNKKSQAFHSELSEIDYLNKRNAYLKQEEAALAAEIQQLKDLMVAQLSSSLSQK